jgi:hypothetical protein
VNKDFATNDTSQLFRNLTIGRISVQIGCVNKPEQDCPSLASNLPTLTAVSLYPTYNPSIPSQCLPRSVPSTMTMPTSPHTRPHQVRRLSQNHTHPGRPSPPPPKSTNLPLNRPTPHSRPQTSKPTWNKEPSRNQDLRRSSSHG